MGYRRTTKKEGFSINVQIFGTFSFKQLNTMILKKNCDQKLINGKVYAESLTTQIKQDVINLQQISGITPGLAVILVGNDSASEVYVRNKTKQTHAVGMRSFMHLLPEKTTEEELVKLIKRLNQDTDIHGILVQLPLPKHLNTDTIIQAILPSKDVDGLTAYNTGKLSLGHQDGFVPCTPLGCMYLLQKEAPPLKGLHAVIIGASNLMGKPMAQILLNQNCTVSIAHIDTVHPELLARQADILIVATGCQGLVKGSWIKPGAIVIDVGIHRIETTNGKTKLIGDVVFDEAIAIASKITPVPGGVGPMTIACLLQNTLKAAKKMLN
ncbi:Bifunctional protein FolD protein [Commensalibacter sp. Nvir]|nr:Bifunctional protein FolD protein [Commensalibacter sp. Nvir]